MLHLNIIDMLATLVDINQLLYLELAKYVQSSFFYQSIFNSVRGCAQKLTLGFNLQLVTHPPDSNNEAIHGFRTAANGIV